MSLLTNRLKLKCFANPFWSVLNRPNPANEELYFQRKSQKHLHFSHPTRDLLALAQFDYWSSQVDKSDWEHFLESYVTISGSHQGTKILLKETIHLYIDHDFALPEWISEDVKYSLTAEVSNIVRKTSFECKTRGLEPVDVWSYDFQHKKYLEEVLETLESHKNAIYLATS